MNKGGSDHGFSPSSPESLALGPEVMQSIMAVGTCEGGVIHPTVMMEHREEGGERAREHSPKLTVAAHLCQCQHSEAEAGGSH